MEEWRPIPSKPGLLASSLGRVRSKPRFVRMPNGGMRLYVSPGTFGTVKRANKDARHSYLGANYKGFGNVKIHQAVCEAFHGPSPFPGAVVIHIDEDAHNNRPDNLKWGTQKENLNSAGYLAYCATRTGPNSPRTKGMRKA